MKLKLEYDGTCFSGYQSQGQGERTVQSILTKAITHISPREPIAVYAAGRTDTGVHALGQVISFQTSSPIPIERFAIALNSNLPSDVSVVQVEEQPRGFHARFSAKSRTYGYLLWTRTTRSAIWGRYSLHVRSPLNVAAMRSAAQHLVGIHDFAAYGKAGDVKQPTVREIESLSIRCLSEGRVLVVVTASGFLRSMVRNIVGMLLEVGKENASPDTAWEVLQLGRRAANPYPPAAPQGLFLWHVRY